MSHKHKLQINVIDKKTKAVRYSTQKEVMNYEFVSVADLIQSLKDKYMNCRIDISVL